VLRSDVPDDAVRDTTNFSASKLKKVFELAKAWMRARGHCWARKGARDDPDPARHGSRPAELKVYGRCQPPSVAVRV
jgi:hypothetical protein